MTDTELLNLILKHAETIKLAWEDGGNSWTYKDQLDEDQFRTNLVYRFERELKLDEEDDYTDE